MSAKQQEVAVPVATPKKVTADATAVVRRPARRSMLHELSLIVMALQLCVLVVVQVAVLAPTMSKTLVVNWQAMGVQILWILVPIFGGLFFCMHYTLSMLACHFPSAAILLFYLHSTAIIVYSVLVAFPSLARTVQGIAVVAWFSVHEFFGLPMDL